MHIHDRVTGAFMCTLRFLKKRDCREQVYAGSKPHATFLERLVGQLEKTGSLDFLAPEDVDASAAETDAPYCSISTRPFAHFRDG